MNSPFPRILNSVQNVEWCTWCHNNCIPLQLNGKDYCPYQLPMQEHFSSLITEKWRRLFFFRATRLLCRCLRQYAPPPTIFRRLCSSSQYLQWLIRIWPPGRSVGGVTIYLPHVLKMVSSFSTTFISGGCFLRASRRFWNLVGSSAIWFLTALSSLVFLWTADSPNTLTSSTTVSDTTSSEYSSHASSSGSCIPLRRSEEHFRKASDATLAPATAAEFWVAIGKRKLLNNFKALDFYNSFPIVHTWNTQGSKPRGKLLHFLVKYWQRYLPGI